MVHPVQSVIESLYAAGRCPRLHVNALAEGVVCPDFIREQWRERLIIDLDPSYPLDLTFTEDHLEADLSFGGYISRCMFPYAGIYVVADRSTGRGIVLDQNMPESVRKSRYGDAASAPKASPRREGPELRPVETAPDPLEETRENVPLEPKPAAAPASTARDTQPPPSTPDDEKARKRRAAFRVIDGGT